jgi:hypothetical protein
MMNDEHPYWIVPFAKNCIPPLLLTKEASPLET